MLNIGCHLSSAKGYLHMGEEALALGANTFQFFTRNPRGGRAKAIDTEDIRALLALMRENSFAPLLAHAPYTLNACSADSKIRDFARMVMTEDLQLLELLPGTRYNFHPGSHVKQGAEQGIIMIAELLNEILRPQQQTMVLLETMAGKGSEVGRNFTELRSIIDRVELQGKLGVCLDTCHVFDGGYDIVNDLESVLEEFDKIIGLDQIAAFHINDSKNPLGAAKDRHENFGKGYLGSDALMQVIRDSRFEAIPKILETPYIKDPENPKKSTPPYKEEIAMLRAGYHS